MIAIRNYGDTKNELEIAQNRLNLLLDRKEELYTKYCGISTPNLDDVKIQTSHVNNNKMADYIYELTRIRKNGLSLEQDIEQQQNTVSKLKYYLNIMKHNLKTMKSIEYKLYYAIVVEARGITGGIDQVSFEANKDVSTIWRVYYPKIEKEIKKLEII